MITRKNVLIVDDDPIFKLIARKLFERTGEFFHAVTFAENGLDAIQHLKKSLERNEAPVPDIILLDIEMPVMNGWDFMDEFIKLPTEKTKDIEVYTVSSSIAQEDKNKTASYPQIKDYITKPLTIDTIKHIAGAL